MRSVLKTARLGLFTLAAVLGITGTSEAAYDIDTRGVPKFVNVNYIELAKITRLSKFRSMAGHNYSDNSQFGPNGYKDSTNRIEQSTSMKHYFIAPDATVKIVSPVAGSVSTIRVGPLGSTVEIQPDSQPDFSIGIFHVELTTPLAIGQHVSEGQPLGHHTGTETWSDMSVWVQTPRGKHLISYFETLTDAVFAQFLARGVPSRASLIRTKAERAADPNVCSFIAADTDFVPLSGTVATQAVQAVGTLPATLHIGDAPLAVKGSASSGLPVEVLSDTPKICTTASNMVSARRPGVCKLRITQPGDATTLEAYPVRVSTLVLPAGAAETARPRLGMVMPPGGSGPQSFIRFFNGGTTAGTVTASLLDGATGQVLAKWKSPSIPPGASPQFAVTQMEAAATTPFARPALYSLRIEPETTIDGFLQHVMFDSGRETITNASTCDVGTMTSGNRMINVHSSNFDFGYPSTLVLNNIGITSAAMTFAMRDATDGRLVGRFYSGRLPAATKLPSIALPTQHMVMPEYAVETVVAPDSNTGVTVNISPPPVSQFNFIDEGTLSFTDSAVVNYYYQHYVTNKRSGVISDMSTVCGLNGRSTGTSAALLAMAGIQSTLQTGAQSVFRFYNAGAAAGPVKVTLYGTVEDQPLGTWVSPAVAPGSMLETSIATIEKELVLHRVDSYVPPALVKQNTYAMTVQTAIDGAFQHVTGRTDGPYANLSVCNSAVITQPRELMAVNTAANDAAGYASTIVISNTGTAAAAARLSVFDARDGTLLGSAETQAVPAGGLYRLDVATLELGAHITPDAARKYYIVKADDGFPGFLQHLVLHKSSGIITDMTAVCSM